MMSNASSKGSKKKTENVMRQIRVAKVTLNIGTGKEKSAL